ncbi:A-kinase anchor protein 14 [Nothobranchius furzeri]|uniref:A-kinase anchoring protein 14 n=1 Tax=Nothobranchius furzeri TaxID=105023 RepID=A0A8C6M019_NOTFU|nr:A-kinase anchor protein 14 [Nothobranchius furzeri]KAF7229080.1 A-kinase anchoring protein 14 [Nothobranchius furzeri]
METVLQRVLGSLFDRSDEVKMDTYTAESSLLVKAWLDRQKSSEKQGNNSNGTQTDTFQWITCRDFTVELGKEQINDYIQTWGIRPCWRHSVNFLYSTEETHGTLYHYRARFGTPTARRPVTRTACVYFAVEVTKNESQSLPVEVYFIVESNRLVHSAGESRVREEWLADVIENKTLVQTMMDLFDQ